MKKIEFKDVIHIYNTKTKEKTLEVTYETEKEKGKITATDIDYKKCLFELLDKVVKLAQD